MRKRNRKEKRKQRRAAKIAATSNNNVFPSMCMPAAVVGGVSPEQRVFLLRNQLPPCLEFLIRMLKRENETKLGEH